MKEEEIVGIAPTGFLGYGFSFNDFNESVEKFKPNFIAVDAGSTDPGPYYLGSGKTFVSQATVKKELELIISTALKHNIPVIIGSAGGSGGTPHVNWTTNIIKEISEENSWNFPIATIEAEIEKETLHEWLAEDRIKDFEANKKVTAEDINNSTRVVAQMGIEPIIKALSSDAQIIVCGRSCDDAVFAAYPVMKGYDKGLSIHMGKILECGALASEPISMDVMIGKLRKDHFILEPGAQHRACTVTTVASHSFYERENPMEQEGPGGAINLMNTKVNQETERAVRVSDTKFVENKKYYIKLEGVRQEGHRVISIAGVRDPVMINNIELIFKRMREHAEEFVEKMGYGTYDVNFHAYGKDGVMKQFEPRMHKDTHELGIVIDVVAENEDKAMDICHEISGKLMHLDFPNQYNNAGNLAFLYSPSEIYVGEVYSFSLYHLVEIDDPYKPFPIKVFHLDNGNVTKEVTL